MSRLVVLLARPPVAGAAPPGVDEAAFAQALVEDAYDAVGDLSGVDVCVAVPSAAETAPGWRSTVGALLWPQTPLIDVAELADLFDDAGPVPGAPGDAVAVVAADVPDLPDLVVAGVFSALAAVPVAAAPALRGGLVALGWRRPTPMWLRAAAVDLDRSDAVDQLRAAAPEGGLEVTRPWRRLRHPTDIESLDPGLEGWEATRALLSRGAGRVGRGR